MLIGNRVIGPTSTRWVGRRLIWRGWRLDIAIRGQLATPPRAPSAAADPAPFNAGVEVRAARRRGGGERVRRRTASKNKLAKVDRLCKDCRCMTATTITRPLPRPATPRRHRLLAPDILDVVEDAEAAATAPAHTLTAAELRAAHDREAAALAGPGPRLASVGDLVIPGPHGWLPMRAYAPVRGAGPAGRRVLPRRRLDRRLDRVVRRGGARAGGRLARARGQRRLPARARASVSGAGRRGRRGDPLARRQRRGNWAATARGSRSPATARAPTWPPSPRAACATRTARR